MLPRDPRPSQPVVGDHTVSGESGVSNEKAAKVLGEFSHTLLGPAQAHDSGSAAASAAASTARDSSVFGSLAETNAILSPANAFKWHDSVREALDAASEYQRALGALGTASAKFAAALDKCARSRAGAEVSDSLHAAEALHLVLSNHIHLLCSTVDSKLDPSRTALAAFQDQLKTREQAFKTDLKQKTADLRTAERKTQKMSKQKNKNLNEYRTALLDMTALIDDISRLKYEFLTDLQLLSTALGRTLANGLGAVAAAELHVFEGTEGLWSESGIDSLIRDHEAFESQGTMFSVLPRDSIFPRRDAGDDDDANETLNDAGNDTILASTPSP